jgi:Regulator of ribonuclease activity B
MRALISIAVTTLAMVHTPNATAADSSTHPDALVILQLKKHGSNLAKPHVIDFHFYYFKEKRSAEELATVLKSKGFTSRISFSDKDSDWNVIATKSMIPEFRAISAQSAEFEKLAKDRGGKYDGWETQIVE